MRIPLSALPFGGGSVGTRIRNLRRKKTPLWLTAIAAFLCLVLSACLLTDQEVQQETETGTGANDGFVHNYMSYGVCGTEDTVYFLPSYYSDQICYVDKATGTSGPLCGKPECKHGTTTCNAYVNQECGISIYNGRIYWLGRGNEFKAKLYSCALDGTDHRTDRELTAEVLPKSWNKIYSFVDSDTMFLVMVADGVNGFEPDGCLYILAIPLDPEQEVTVILNEYAMPKQYADSYIATAVYDGGLYLLTDRPADPKSPDYDPGTGKYVVQIRRWDMETHELETLYEDLDSDYFYHTTLAVDETGIYFNQTHVGQYSDSGIYRLALGASEPELLFSMGPYVFGNIGISGGIAAGSHIFGPNEGEQEGLYVIIRDLEGNVLIDNTYDMTDWGIPEPEDGFQYSVITYAGTDGEKAYFLGAFESSGGASAIVEVDLKTGACKVDEVVRKK